MQPTINIKIQIEHKPPVSPEPPKPKYRVAHAPDINPGYNASNYRKRANNLLDLSITGRYGACCDDIEDLLGRYKAGSADDIPDRQVQRFYMRLWYLIDWYYEIEHPTHDED